MKNNYGEYSVFEDYEKYGIEDCFFTLKNFILCHPESRDSMKRLGNLLEDIIHGNVLLIKKDEIVKDLTNLNIKEHEYLKGILTAKSIFQINIEHHIDKDFFNNLSRENKNNFIEELKESFKFRLSEYLIEKYGINPRKNYNYWKKNKYLLDIIIFMFYNNAVNR